MTKCDVANPRSPGVRRLSDFHFGQYFNVNKLRCSINNGYSLDKRRIANMWWWSNTWVWGVIRRVFWINTWVINARSNGCTVIRSRLQIIAGGSIGERTLRSDWNSMILTNWMLYKNIIRSGTSFGWYILWWFNYHNSSIQYVSLWIMFERTDHWSVVQEKCGDRF